MGGGEGVVSQGWLQGIQHKPGQVVVNNCVLLSKLQCHSLPHVITKYHKLVIMKLFCVADE